MLHIRLDCRLHNSRVFAQWRVVIVLELLLDLRARLLFFDMLGGDFPHLLDFTSLAEGKEDICCFGTLILLKLSQSKRIFSNRLFRYHFNGFEGLVQKYYTCQPTSKLNLRPCVERKKVQNCTHDVFHPLFPH